MFCLLFIWIFFLLLFHFSPYDIWFFYVVRQVVKNTHKRLDLMKQNDQESKKHSQLAPMVWMRKVKRRANVMMISVISDRTFRSLRSSEYLFVFNKKYTRPVPEHNSTHTHTHRVRVRCVSVFAIRRHPYRILSYAVETHTIFTLWNFIDRPKINFNINYLTIWDWEW